MTLLFKHLEKHPEQSPAQHLWGAGHSPRFICCQACTDPHTKGGGGEVLGWGSYHPSFPMQTSPGAQAPHPGKATSMGHPSEGWQRGCHGPSKTPTKGSPGPAPEHCMWCNTMQHIYHVPRDSVKPAPLNVYQSIGFYTLRWRILTTNKTRQKEAKRSCWNPWRVVCFYLISVTLPVSPQHTSFFYIFLSFLFLFSSFANE